MEIQKNIGGISSQDAVGRLTALWALSEAGLGGLMHAFKLPFTAVLVGGTAICLIAMIAHHGGSRAILRALVTVLIVKALASPQSPPTAYLAVAFQGLAGWALFGSPLSFRVAALGLGILALLQSAFQKLMVLYLIYGKALPEALDIFGGYVARQLGQGQGMSLSYGVAGVYVGIYALAGVWTGWLAGRLPGLVQARMAQWPADEHLSALDTSDRSADRSRGRAWVRGLWVLVLILVILVQGGLWWSGGEGLWWRAVTGWLLWYGALLPVWAWWVVRYARKSRHRETLTDLYVLLPQVRACWQAVRRRHAGSPWYRRLTGQVTDMLVLWLR